MTLTYHDAPEVAEAIARGDDCPGCGARWEPWPTGGAGARQLNHADDCPTQGWFNFDGPQDLNDYDDEFTMEYILGAVFHVVHPHRGKNCYACYCDLPPTATCPEHGEQEIVGSGSTGPLHDPWNVDVLACGHALNPFFDEPTILEHYRRNDPFM